jgi:four helix bundle protein
MEDIFIKKISGFAFIARGSILETKNHLHKAVNRNLIDGETHNELINDLKIIHRKLNGYIKFLRRTYLSAKGQTTKPIDQLTD